MRVLGVIVGCLFLSGPALMLAFGDGLSWEIIPMLFLGAAFVGYGLGGQRLLRKIAPSLARRKEGDSSYDE